MTLSQEEFAYATNVLDALDGTISASRIGTFLRASGFDRTRAVKMYLWNSRVSEAFYFPLQCAEVVLRNSINEALSDVYGRDWPTDLKFGRLISPETELNIQRVQERLIRAGYKIETDRIVAGLSFDFWATMLKKDFDRPVWQTRLRTVFPHLPGGFGLGDMRELVRNVKNLRNRIAHHEPILRVNHSAMHTNILRVIRFRCPQTANWVSQHSRVLAVLRERP